MAGQGDEFISGGGAQSVHRAEKVYSVYQVADLLGSPPGEVMQWIEKGWLQCRRVGNEPIRVGLSQLLDFLQKRGIDITNVLARSVNIAASAAKVTPAQAVVVESLPPEAAPRDSRQSGTGVPSVSSHVADVPPAREPVRTVPNTSPHDQQEINHGQDAHATDGQDGRATETHGQALGAPDGDAHVTMDGVGQLAGAVLVDAVARGASAIHVESWRGGSLTLRYRIDGLLHDKTNFTSRLPSSAAWTLLLHLGQMSGMDLAKGRMPATGQFSLQVEGRQVNFHTSSCPTLTGRHSLVSPGVALVIDILDAKRVAGLEELVLPTAYEKLTRVLQHEGGLVIVAGMPRSGKNAILRAMLDELVAQPSRRGSGFAAIQNAPGAMIDGVRYVQVQPELGFTFTKAMGAIRRQDCDVVLAGDMRDPECASACLEMALEGRMVLAGVTARNGGGAMAALEMMALEPWPLASALLAVVASAQLPRLCDHCKTRIEPQHRDKWLQKLDLSIADGVELFAPGSCSRCGLLGYSGKVNLVGVAECGGEIADRIRGRAWTELKQGDVAAMASTDLKVLAIEHLRTGSITPDAVARASGL